MTVLMLSEAEHRIEIFRKCCQRRGLTLDVARSLRSAQKVLHAGQNGVLVFDAGVWTWPEVQGLLAQDLQGWSVLVVLPSFTAREWMGAFKAGAAEVITEPLSPAKVEAALDAVAGLARPVPTESAGKSFFDSLLNRFRSLLSAPPG